MKSFLLNIVAILLLGIIEQKDKIKQLENKTIKYYVHYKCIHVA